jgi:hypothetical protein
MVFSNLVSEVLGVQGYRLARRVFAESHWFACVLIDEADSTYRLWINKRAGDQ